MAKQGSPDARRIVANLAWRYRFAKRRCVVAVAFPVLKDELMATREEAWNAYIASKRILLGLDP